MRANKRLALEWRMVANLTVRETQSMPTYKAAGAVERQDSAAPGPLKSTLLVAEACLLKMGPMRSLMAA